MFFLPPFVFLIQVSHIFVPTCIQGAEVRHWKETTRSKGSERAAVAGEGTANIGGKHQLVNKDREFCATLPRRYTECSVGTKWSVFGHHSEWEPGQAPWRILLQTRWPHGTLFWIWLKDLPLGPMGIWSSVPSQFLRASRGRWAVPQPLGSDLP